MKRFSLIVAIDEENGIGKDGRLPWHHPEDMKHFRSMTQNSVIIMGSRTFSTMPKELVNRQTVVISSAAILNVLTYPSLALALCRPSYNYDKIYIIGGQQLFDEALTCFSDFCDMIYVSHLPGKYNCDTFFDYNSLAGYNRIIEKRETFILETIFLDSGELQYLKLLRHILSNGNSRNERTGVGTLSVFGESLKFDLRHGFPLLTTKKTWFGGIVKELLFFISGSTDTKILEAQGVSIWKGNTSAEFLKKAGLPWTVGDMGPGYSFQWRHAGADYKGCDVDYTGQGVDQIKQLIDGLKRDPTGRRHIISAWNVSQLPQMALPPCHCFCQFYVEDQYLDCSMYQRSADMFLGVPFNIASYALLMSLIAKVVGLTPRYFNHYLGDTHIYKNHIDAVKEQLTRRPYPMPKLILNDSIINIFSVKASDIKIEDYQCHEKISGTMAV